MRARLVAIDIVGYTWQSSIVPIIIASMTLRKFVADTLNQITDGVADAQEKNPNIAPPVAPSATGESYRTYKGGVNNPTAFLVDFDVAVTTSKTTKVDAGGGVSIHVFEAGAKSKTSAERATVNRIKFQVPVMFDNVK